MPNEKRLIDANALLEKLKKTSRYFTVKFDIEGAPTVDAVEVVHAEWGDGGAVDRKGNIVYKSINCSNCEEVLKIESETREYWKARFKVCPFCGAVMDGGNDR